MSRILLRRLRAMCLVGLAAIGLQGCELAVLGAAGGAVYSVAEDRRTSGTQIDDEAIQVRARSRVSDRFGDKVHLTVTSFNRMVLLTGEVPDAQTRDAIGNIVLGVPTVRAITNEIQVTTPTNRASRINDEIITTKVKARLINSGKVSPVHAKVVTEAGVVYLLGVVTEKEADAAVNVARTTGGVRKVVKIFEYCKAGEEVCRPRPAPASGLRQKPSA